MIHDVFTPWNLIMYMLERVLEQKTLISIKTKMDPAGNLSEKMAPF